MDTASFGNTTRVCVAKSVMISGNAVVFATTERQTYAREWLDGSGSYPATDYPYYRTSSSLTIRKCAANTASQSGSYWIISYYALTPVFTRGTYISDVTSTDENAYPADGVHTDGYWYIKQS